MEMTVTRQANKVGMRQLARFGGEAMTWSKTSDGETKMLKSFSRREVREAHEDEIESAVAAIVRVCSGNGDCIGDQDENEEEDD